MRVGFTLVNFTNPGGPATLGADIARVARAAEAAGFESFWLWDHFFNLGPVGHGVTDKAMLEAYTLLGYVAGVTQRIKLGTMVTGVTYRHPGVLVKEVTTLDVLSGGRAYLGIGAAWFQDEHESLGVPFPPLKERFERLEEALQIAHQMWRDGGNWDAAQPFDGRHYQLKRTLNVPQVLQRPHPPILIGGGGETKTLKFVAKYADACNLGGGLSPDAITHKLDVLRGHCETVGRPYSDIYKTSFGGMQVARDGRDGALSPQQAIDYCAERAALGIDEAVIVIRDPYASDAFEAFASEVIPAVAKIAVAGR